MTSVTSSAPTTPGEPKSNPPASPTFFPALNARPRTTANATPFRKTSVQIVELNRDFMPPSKSFYRSRAIYRRRLQNSNAGPRKDLKQPAQVNDQRQPVVVPQHSYAMRDVFGRLLEKVFVLHGIRSDHFVGCNPDAHVF